MLTNMKKKQKRKRKGNKGTVARKPEKSSKSSFAVIIAIIAMIISLGIVSYLRFTGYAVLDNADIFAGKDTYNIGDTVHLYVLPHNATHIIEVYDADGNLYAN